MDIQENTAEILDRYIGGFRQYILQEPLRSVFISRNFCEMTGYAREEFTGDGDPCAALVYPGDRPIYQSYVKRLVSEKRSGEAEYRIVRKDGSVLFVRDTTTVRMREDGVFVGYSVLTDITALKAEYENFIFLNETVPFGMLKCTCEKNPKITQINNQMIKILRLPKTRDGEMDYLEFYKDNIYLMIPIEERRKFSHFLNRVYATGTPIEGEISVLRGDGTKARLYGWIAKVTGADGREEFQSVCIDVTERHRSRRARETEGYVRALSDIFEKIFEYDFADRTVKYVFGNTSTFGRIRNMPMRMEEATEKWIDHNVCPEDRARMHEFFAGAFSRRAAPSGAQPLQIQYKVDLADGEKCNYQGIFLKIDAMAALFCCRRMRDEKEADILRSENISLKTRNESIQEMIMRYPDGIAAFEVTGEYVTPLYASDNVCQFFGFSREELLELMKKSTPIGEFVSRSAVDYEKFMELLKNGEAEFTYYDIGKGAERQIKAICSQKSDDPASPRYVLLCKINREEGKELAAEPPRIYIRTFGYFDVFIDDKPIAFRNKKAKELLALLVDRRGGYVTSEEAIGYLWENEPANAVTLARYRKEALRLKNTLEEYGIGNIIESVDGKRRIVPERIRCDLYDYLSHKKEYDGLFKGSYLTNYAWGEITLGDLMNASRTM